MRQRLSFNDDWFFNKTFSEAMIEVDYAEAEIKKVRIPHTVAITPYNYFSDSLYQGLSCYRKHFEIPKSWEKKEVYICFDAVAHIADIFVNEKFVGQHKGGYTAFRFNISPFLVFDKTNVLTVKVNSNETSNIPPFGNVIDYLTYGGIYREVWLDVCDPIGIDDVFIVTCDGENNNKAKKVQVEVGLSGISLEKSTANKKLRYSIIDAQKNSLYSGFGKLNGLRNLYSFEVSGVQDWDIDNPTLYFLKVELIETELEAGPSDLILDSKMVRFGFRTCEFKKDGFYLNHKKVKILGLNRHQSYPYVGYAMPKRQQERDADLLKNELGLNAVRTSHYPQSQYFIDRCDELGLLVFTEIPGWQHIGNTEWKEVAIENVKEMVLQYRNHPSIILWGVRINESQDDDEFYTQTNKVAHSLDSSRQTGGVRYISKSNLLEDVYTYNDFLHNGKNAGLSPKHKITSNNKAPYLISEFNGHMFPTKAFDDEAHRLDHALRHARVLNDIWAPLKTSVFRGLIDKNSEVSGGFGWCMFDYNTHKDFGSGDTICYHGVLDMFRNKKIAASVYASQSNKASVFELSSSLHIGEHASGNIEKVYAFTNADTIRLYKNNCFVKEYKAHSVEFKDLPHPPILIDDFIGELLETQEKFSTASASLLKKVLLAVKKYGANNLPLKYKLVMAYLMLKEKLSFDDGLRLYYAYVASWGGKANTIFKFEALKNGKVFKTIIKESGAKPYLEIKADTKNLVEDTSYDVAAINIRALDAWGNLLPYFQQAISLKTTGSVELVGPSLISLQGGMCGTFIKTKGIEGKGLLTISNEYLGIQIIEFEVRVNHKEVVG